MATASTTAPSLYEFDDSKGEWIRTRRDTSPQQGSSRPTAGARLKLTTWNVFSCDPTHVFSQTYYVLKLLNAQRSDVIALQEVSRSFERTLRMQTWVRKHYMVTSAEEYARVAGRNGSVDKGGRRKEGSSEAVVLLVRKGLVVSAVGIERIESTTVESGKAVLSIRIRHRAEQAEDPELVTTILTGHMSSMPHNADVRQSQLESIVQSAQPNTADIEAAVFLGDLNTADPIEFGPLLDAGFEDACPPQRVYEPTFGSLFPYIEGSPKPRKARRIDYVFVRGSVLVEEYALFGDGEPVHDKRGSVVRNRLGKSGLLWPSDHLGITVRVRLGQS